MRMLPRFSVAESNSLAPVGFVACRGTTPKPHTIITRITMLDKIRKYPDPILEKECEEVEFDAKARFLAKRLMACLDVDRKHRLAVAAPQIGVLKRAFSFNLNNFADDVFEAELHKLKSVAFNPSISAVGSAMRTVEEGCLSFRKPRKVRRPDGITVEFYDYKGERTELKLLGMASRVFQHEIDHINGILIIDRAEGGALEYD